MVSLNGKPGRDPLAKDHLLTLSSQMISLCWHVVKSMHFELTREFLTQGMGVGQTIAPGYMHSSIVHAIVM